MIFDYLSSSLGAITVEDVGVLFAPLVRLVPPLWVDDPYAYVTSVTNRCSNQEKYWNSKIQMSENSEKNCQVCYNMIVLC